MKCGNSYGIVLELIGGASMGKMLNQHPERMDKYAQKYVDLLRDLHSIEAKSGEMIAAKDIMHETVNRMKSYLTEDELAVMHRLVDAIPDANTLVHGDFHPGNILIQDDELVLIDMADISRGCPLIDLGAIYRDLKSVPQSRPEILRQSAGMEPEQLYELWDKFKVLYCGTEDPNILEPFEKRCASMCAFSSALAGFKPSSSVANNPTILQKIAEQMIRSAVLPNAESLCALFSCG